jgi:hypothetical protein
MTMNRTWRKELPETMTVVNICNKRLLVNITNLLSIRRLHRVYTIEPRD